MPPECDGYVIVNQGFGRWRSIRDQAVNDPASWTGPTILVTIDNPKRIMSSLLREDLIKRSFWRAL